MVSNREIVVIPLFLMLMLVFSGCDPQVPAVVSGPPMLRVNCNPGIITKEIPELASQFDALAPGGKLIAVLYRNVPPSDRSEFGLTGEVRIDQGTFSVKFKNGDITYEANGNVILNWKDRSLQALETPVSDYSYLHVSLRQDGACAIFPTLTLRDGSPVPEVDRTNLLYLPSNGGDRADEYILEIQKSSDFRAKPSNFSVTRGL